MSGEAFHPTSRIMLTRAPVYATPARSDTPVAGYRQVLDKLVADGLVDHYHVGGVSRDKGIGTGHVLVNNWPEAYAREYFANRRYLDDPIVRVLRASHGTVTPDDLARAFAVSPSDQRRVDEARAHGLALPLCFTVGPASQVIGCVTFRRRKPYTPEEIAMLGLLAPGIHRGARLAWYARNSRGTDVLSPRERECIAWSSLGKSSWEIGEILGIAKQTADVHLKSAIQKLNADSRAHAVAEALRLGLID